ncbi:putative hydro-lyase [Alkaliphilus pronyensis]|uniref:Putative hydro-lyase F8154_11455 n=1 Tax=Alkaliphilus pronyensis TaxID=1482732 RepID=A0A6I0F8V9_9FIRM|nr:putative hydro-lyase [Alkaliphilus pronyensis]KAB3532757.1 putative hydro-lyase [Alkaliphilus pronyensis]
MEIYNGKAARKLIRENKWMGPTPSLAPGFTQANLVIVPYKYAFDFFLFCQRNPKPCPVLDVCERGEYTPILTAATGDLRKDLPKYRIYKNGLLTEEVSNIVNLWNNDFVSFLLGCSFTFENALMTAGIPIRHIEENKNVPMYITNINCLPAGIFSGNMVVSMRPIPRNMVDKAKEITSQFPKVHGAPIHVGSPEEIGIVDINSPDYGDRVTFKGDEVPVFWACGVTPQVAIMRAKLELVITHSPGHMFITDLKDEELKKL